ncbi:PRTRC system protein C [Deinococcus sonorensis]|uniref:PRTRC system protein C n=1 Tax=Deinococcus sonorensis TaxID=309891 RepID=A0ABV8YAZ3_9DEIO
MTQSPLIAQSLTRVIVYQDRELPDTAPDQPIEVVQRHHAAAHPALTTAVLDGPFLVNGRHEYRVRVQNGTKG